MSNSEKETLKPNETPYSRRNTLSNSLTALNLSPGDLISLLEAVPVEDVTDSHMNRLSSVITDIDTHEGEKNYRESTRIETCLLTLRGIDAKHFTEKQLSELGEVYKTKSHFHFWENQKLSEEELITDALEYFIANSSLRSVRVDKEIEFMMRIVEDHVNLLISDNERSDVTYYSEIETQAMGGYVLREEAGNDVQVITHAIGATYAQIVSGFMDYIAGRGVLGTRSMARYQSVLNGDNSKIIRVQDDSNEVICEGLSPEKALLLDKQLNGLEEKYRYDY